MTTDRHATLASTLDMETLQPVVRAILGQSSAQTVNWECHPVSGGVGGGQLVRITGTATVGQADLAWSVFLKVLRKETEPDKMKSSPDGWKREPLAYRSGVLDDLAGGMEAATCYLIDDRTETEIWMWLEDLSGAADAPWSVQRYGLAARHIGQLNGFYLTEDSLPSYPWQLEEFDREMLGRLGDIERFRRIKDEPVIRRLVPPDFQAMVFQLWERRESYLVNLYDRMPQTFGHMDAGRFNLFSRDEPDADSLTVAIDWAQIGTAPIGKEIKPLILHSVAFGCIDVASARELDETAFVGYVDGLRDMGWGGDPRLARYGYTMLVAMHSLRSFTSMESWVTESGRRAMADKAGTSFDELLERRLELNTFVLELIEESLKLDDELFQSAGKVV